MHQGDHPRSTGIFECYEGGIGCLKEFDLSDIALPLSEIRQYIQIYRDKVYDLHPKVFEDVVGSVFRDHGWAVQVTAYSGDGGVDVFLSGGDKTIGVQVKKNKRERKVEAEQIRALAGALMLNGLSEGVFVTTSSFRNGAVKAAEKFGRLGYPIRLLDCEGFFETLEIAQQNRFTIDNEVICKRIFSKAAYWGSGIERPYTEKEDVYRREIISTTYGLDDFISERRCHIRLKKVAMMILAFNPT